MKDCIYPIYFLDGTCPECGKKDLSMVDKMGYTAKEKERHMYPLTCMHCNTCDTDFAIKWIPGDGDNWIPVATGFNEIKYNTDYMRDSLNSFLRSR